MTNHLLKLDAYISTLNIENFSSDIANMTFRNKKYFFQSFYFLFLLFWKW